MITGFNTDIEFGGVTYHIQTEDKGVASPFILSLVYDGGTILASKRASYEDLLNGELDTGELSGRLLKQHKLICAAVRRGRLEDLKRRHAATPRGVTLAQMSVKGAAVDTGDFAIPKPKWDKLSTLTIDFTDDELPMLNEVRIVEDENILPEEAVAVLGDSAPAKSSNHRLTVEIIGDSVFRSGERKVIGIMVCRGSERKVIGDAQVMIKILGSNFRPVIFHAKTDRNGIATANLQVPHLTSGRAAIMIRAMTGGEEVEIRRAVATR